MNGEANKHIEKVKGFIADSEKQLEKARKVSEKLEKEFPSRRPKEKKKQR